MNTNRNEIQDLCRESCPTCPLFNYFVAHYLAMPSTSCDVERMFGVCARQFDGRESLDVEQLEAEVRVVDFVHSGCKTPDEFGQMCDKIAQHVWEERMKQKNKNRIE